MAEFFSECINKIKIFLGPSTKEVAPVHNYFKNANRGAYKRILENNFDSLAIVRLHTGKNFPPMKNIMDTFKYFYGCGSLSNLGKIYIVESTVVEEQLTDDGSQFFRKLLILCRT
jgi:hypothetical protein